MNNQVTLEQLARMAPRMIEFRKKWMRDHPGDGGISDLDMERAKRDKRAMIGGGIGAGIGTGAGIALTPLLGPMAIPAGTALGSTAGQAVGYNWKPVQDTWKKFWG